MKILIGDNGNVDFDGPIEATDDQIDKTINFFKNNFRQDVVEIDDLGGFRTERIGEKLFQKEWIVSEYAALLDFDKDTEEIADELGRTWMSVDIQRGQWIPRFITWMEINSRNLFAGDMKKLVQEYLNYLNEQKQLKKEQRREYSRKKTLLEKEVKQLEKTLERQLWMKDTLSNKETGIVEAINNTKGLLEVAKKKLDEMKD